MCGLCGRVNAEILRTVDAREIKAMTATIAHRGPDDVGFLMDKNVGLGFRRLSIIDLRTGHQPQSNEDGTIWIVFNGEIYNYPELQRLLVSKGHVFKTRSDTENILHLYEEYGEACVAHLRGMFAFAIYDQPARKLFCARDRFGEKPFYYYCDSEKFLFGSELKAILACEDVPGDIDTSALDYYFAYGYTPRDRSIFRGINKLLPAHTLTLRYGDRFRVAISKYWHIRFEPDYVKTETQWIEEIEEEFHTAVKLRLLSDVPLGAFLSGGIDSSAVLAEMSRCTPEPVKTFSIGFNESEFSELPYAKEVAAKYQTEHHEKIVVPQSVELLSQVVRAFDEPFADPSAIPTMYVSRFAADKVKVVLSGDGGDELFAGYPRYPLLLDIRRYNKMPKWMKKTLWGSLHRMLPLHRRGKILTYYLAQNPDNTAAFVSLWPLTERKKLFNRTFYNEIRQTPAEVEKMQILSESTAPEYLSKIQELDLNTILLDDMLTKVDRASMQHSLEVRVPFLDHKFAELTFRMPALLKLKGRRQKYILKKALRDKLPASVLEHRKQGFDLPIKIWFKKELKDYVHDTLLQNNRMDDYLNLPYVRRLVDRHEKGVRDLSGKIWSLLVFNEWLNQNRR